MAKSLETVVTTLTESSSHSKVAGPLDTELKAISSKIDLMSKRLSRLDGSDGTFHIEDLGGLFAKWNEYYVTSDNYKDIVVKFIWEKEIEGLCVQCDPLVLRDVIGALLDNSRDEAVRRNRSVSIQIHAGVGPTHCVALPKVLELVYEDDGDGVTDANRPLIMLHGFTTAEIAKDKGRGLSLISRQLSEYGGHIEPMAARHGVKGARFVIRFGLINNSHVTAREVTHAGIPNCVG